MKLPFRPGMRRGSFEIDMTNGPLVGKIIRFAIPLALSGILQLLFTRRISSWWASSWAPGPGGGGLYQRPYQLDRQLVHRSFRGRKRAGGPVLRRQRYQGLRETVHTSVLASLIFGCIVLVIGITLAAPMLELMGTPEEVLDQACLYMRIYFIGMPASMLYNFGAAILRAVGDTQRPLYFLFIAGIVNVLLNLFCVIVLHMGVEASPSPR